MNDHTEGRNEYTNRVIEVTERKVLLAVRHAFATMPAIAFHAWLVRELERVHTHGER